MNRQGFTLVEMLVALFVFALLSAAGVALMRVAISNQETVRARVDRIAELQRARAVLKTDLSQLAERQVRDREGRQDPTVFFGDPGGTDGAVMRFVRRGIEVADAAPRASLQRVEYRIRAGRLERLAQTAVDGAPLGEPQALLTGVRRAELAFHNGSGWAPSFRGSGLEATPRAVRLDLELEGVGGVTQLFLAGEGGA